MDLAALQSLVAQGESETLEFKATTGLRREGTQTLCAMLNHRGGRVLFGVDKGGRTLGQQVADRTVEEISHEIQHIEPPVFPRINRVEFKPGLQVIAVEVETGPNRPYSYKKQAYKRVGNTTLELSRDEYNRMLLERFHGERRWETEPATGWAVGDLDASELTRTIDEAIRRGRLDDPGTREPIHLLRGLGLLRGDEILRAAVVLFGKQARLETEFSQCLLRVAKFKGTDKAEFLDNRQFHGNAFDLLLKAETFSRENLPIAGRVVPGVFERIDEPLYPREALREALANALCHRDYAIGGGSVGLAIYQDRLEITSTGPLHFGLTAEKLFEPNDSMPWNPLVARVFHRRGVIESWGRGTLKIAELMVKARLPRPEIEELAGSTVVVRFRPSRYVPPKQVKQDLTDRQQAILAFLAQRPTGVSQIGIADHFGITPLETRNELKRLRELSLVVTLGYARGAVWCIAPD